MKTEFLPPGFSAGALNRTLRAAGKLKPRREYLYNVEGVKVTLNQVTQCVPDIPKSTLHRRLQAHHTTTWDELMLPIKVVQQRNSKRITSLLQRSRTYGIAVARERKAFNRNRKRKAAHKEL